MMATASVPTADHIKGGGGGGTHVIKLNYTSLQHPVEAVEAPDEELAASGTSEMPTLVIPLHGHLAPAAWAAEQAASEIKVGFVQSAGGALPGSMSRDVGTLRQRNLLCDHVTVLNLGRVLAEGTPAEIRVHKEVVSAYLGG